MHDSKKFLIYESEDNKVIVDVLVMDDSIWMTQKQMANLFDADLSVVSKHLSNIFYEEELSEEATLAKIARVQKEGNREVSRQLNFYNLDAIIALGYRINSKKATKFRIWATKILKEYMIKGFALDDERLKQGKNIFGEDYFQELLERVRSIRASERRIWQKITDIFAEISIDYDKDSQITKLFYADVQNKFHYAITGQTAAEIINSKADRNKENMGLVTWKNSPNGRILKSDTYVAKNYLAEDEIKQLERNVSGYFDYIEDLIERRNTFTMEDFANSIDKFLEFREYRVLEGHGKISMKLAKEKASVEYEAFNKTQKIVSDFDRSVKKIIDSN
ncbi:virulence RhuM family protein [Peptoniphilus obesi]|uniref:virulence RhuM family protein n=1 Tax=Peptoniphilus obesi TaxID=1472765 RepID=UPI00056AEB64|nr:virulence RhuM family protein [Peptoniphilus obesi]